ncbi:hypothetical protein [Microbacterium sp. No. 7]|uniref:hypothetical protein n=1 Tax=Microbacterium sp. No. 7 TaxID=1714373 RepID=UPI0006CF6BCB|nr:hypothetical protein [Microbacterium sp. No. 7]ALJ22069.1 hypothetical protein AOA12_20120 [Microbacterium sp. No. 7]
MSDTITNLIHIPGVQARVVVDAEYDWATLGALLAEGLDSEQAELLDALAQGLWTGDANGLMQLQYIADHITVDPGAYDKGAVIWFLRELLVRLEGES